MTSWVNHAFRTAARDDLPSRRSAGSRYFVCAPVNAAQQNKNPKEERLKTILAAAAAATLLSLSPAFALEVTKSADIPASPETVWKTIAEFCSIGQWHPAVEKCDPSTKDGKNFRAIALKGGGVIEEEQTATSDADMSYSYKILESPLPVTNYKSTIKVEKSGSGSKVTWMGTFDAKGAPDAKAEEVIGGIYEAGFKGIAEKVK